MHEEKKTCFIIMPLTTPGTYLDKYRDGGEHFMHVLESLFIPSVKKAGYEPIPPRARGSDLIHAEIIGNLESSDLVLCDMSCLNANVFFEFGIRTALNKPVCIVKDELTKRVPFDTAILNHHEYKSTLGAWEVSFEIEALAKHLKDSRERSNEENTLWKHFGFRITARPYEGETGTDAKLDYLSMQMDSLFERIAGLGETFAEPTMTGETVNELFGMLLGNGLKKGQFLSARFQDNGKFVVEHRGVLPPVLRQKIKKLVKRRYGVPVVFVRAFWKSEPVIADVNRSQEHDGHDS